MFDISEDKIGNSKPLHEGRLGLVELRLPESGPGLEEISDEGGLLLVQHSHGRALLAHLLCQHPAATQIISYLFISLTQLTHIWFLCHQRPSVVMREQIFLPHLF